MFVVRSSLFLLYILCVMSNQPSIEDSFRQCLISQPFSGLAHCFGVGTVSKLQSLDNDPQFDLIDGVTLTKDTQEFREAYNFAEQDPSNFRSIVDSLGHVFSRRTLHWDMSSLYPGLAMRLAPSVHSPGQLEFVLDPHREAVTAHSLKEATTGRLLARQFLVPFLLGFKFNIATVLPILFGVIAIIAKKAIILSKIALIIASAYGLGTLLLGNGNKYGSNEYSGSQTFNPGFGGHYNRYPEENPYHSEVYYRTNQQVADQLNLHANLQEAYDRKDKAKGRNFAWSEDEKIKKATS